MDPGKEDASGFPGSVARRYKLARSDFLQHLAAIAASISHPPLTVFQALQTGSGERPLLLTFDDGGVSGSTVIADLLEERGWRGHFFIATNFIGRPGFLSPEQIRRLAQRGHVVGSHSCSHPVRMSRCRWEELIGEWGRSVKILEEILGRPVQVASVPGGYYSRGVAQAAARVGLRVIFNSEPTIRARTVEGCTVLGRYSVYWANPAYTAAQLATGHLWTCAQQSLFWNLKKLAKLLGGNHYLTLWRAVLGHRSSA